MRFFNVILLALLNALTIYGLSIPDPAGQLARRNEGLLPERGTNLIDLFKRKGGGGGGKGGGSSSGGSSSSGSSSSGSSSSGARSGSSNAGGRTSSGSGVTPSYGGGRYYGGGAMVPYSAGKSSSKGFAAAGLLGVGALAFWPGAWLYGCYYYPYTHPYAFYNQSARQNQTKPVQCLCQQYSVCGCEENTDSDYMNGILGNGSVSGLNQSLVHVAEYNGSSTIFINGTLPNGTTAAGGSDSSATSTRMQALGWWAIGGAVAWAMWLL